MKLIRTEYNDIVKYTNARPDKDTKRVMLSVAADIVYWLDGIKTASDNLLFYVTPANKAFDMFDNEISFEQKRDDQSDGGIVIPKEASAVEMVSGGPTLKEAFTKITEAELFKYKEFKTFRDLINTYSDNDNLYAFRFTRDGDAILDGEEERLPAGSKFIVTDKGMYYVHPDDGGKCGVMFGKTDGKIRYPEKIATSIPVAQASRHLGDMLNESKRTNVQRLIKELLSIAKEGYDRITVDDKIIWGGIGNPTKLEQRAGDLIGLKWKTYAKKLENKLKLLIIPGVRVQVKRPINRSFETVRYRAYKTFDVISKQEVEEVDV